MIAQSVGFISHKTGGLNGGLFLAGVSLFVSVTLILLLPGKAHRDLVTGGPSMRTG
jgi:hypothetical protein